MPKHLFQFDCPCCGKRVEVDTRSGKARASDPKEKKGPDFDDLVREQGQASERLDSMFDTARSDQQTQADKLDQMFKDAKDKAKDDDPNERPRNPFDLD